MAGTVLLTKRRNIRTDFMLYLFLNDEGTLKLRWGNT